MIVEDIDCSVPEEIFDASVPAQINWIWDNIYKHKQNHLGKDGLTYFLKSLKSPFDIMKRVKFPEIPEGKPGCDNCGLYEAQNKVGDDMYCDKCYFRLYE